MFLFHDCSLLLLFFFFPLFFFFLTWSRGYVLKADPSLTSGPVLLSLQADWHQTLILSCQSLQSFVPVCSRLRETLNLLCYPIVIGVSQQINHSLVLSVTDPISKWRIWRLQQTPEPWLRNQPDEMLQVSS